LLRADRKGMSSARHDSYRPDIDGLRAIAVLAVVAYHAFPRQLPGGYVGVDVFFVISGFLISGILFDALQRHRFSYGHFYARRVRRIFPALITVLAALLLYGWFGFLPDSYLELGKQTIAGAGFASNLLLWSQSGYFDEHSVGNPLLHLWSLGVEEQFYVVWPLLLAFFHRRGRSLLTFICLLMLGSFVASVVLTYINPMAAFYLPVTRFWELMLGAALAYYVNVRGAARASGETSLLPMRGPSLQLVAGCGVVLLVVALLCINPQSAFPGWWALLPTLGTFLLIAARGSWINRAVLSNRLLVGIGLISYPLYLWHWVLLTIARIAADGEEPTRAHRLAAVALSFVLAWLTYILIEKPIRFGTGRLSRPLSLALGMLVIGAIGSWVFLTDGAVFRYPPQIRPLADFQYDRQLSYYNVAYRSRQCFLDDDQHFRDMPAACVDAANGRPILVALWGDSHAASLYQGLRTQQERLGYFRIAQFTAAGCPPILSTHGRIFKACEAFNRAALEKLQALHPDVVLVEGNWTFDIGSARALVDGAAIRDTIEKLKTIGVKRIVVFGSLPTWKIPQPEVGVKIWLASHSLTDRTRLYFDPTSMSTDAVVAQAAAQTGVTFVSPLSLLCNEQGCLISTDRDAATPVAWDREHLTLAGSNLLVGLAIDQIMGDSGKGQVLPPSAMALPH
jgi:peptidoglycan/LPS O-acetylase OafA/YrhL